LVHHDRLFGEMKSEKRLCVKEVAPLSVISFFEWLLIIETIFFLQCERVNERFLAFAMYVK